MSKKNSSALFEAMSRSKGIKPVPLGGPRSSGGHAVAAAGSSEAVSVSSAPDSAPTGVLETPSWMKKSAPPAASTPTPLASKGTSNAVENDSDRQQIRVRVSYTAVGIIAFGIVATIVLAVMAGKEWSNQRKTSTETTEELLAGPAHPEVLAAGPGNVGTGAPEPEPVGETGSGASSRSPQPPGTTIKPAGIKPGGVALPPAVPGSGSAGVAGAGAAGGVGVPLANGRTSRVVGLNYIVVQSYPDEVDAKGAVDLLAKNGIPATLEKGLAGFPKWLIVVTARGYPRGAKETEDLRKKIDQISADQYRKDRKWKKWEPLPYKWR